MNRVFITGLGIWSCIGQGKKEVTKALYEGRCGLGHDPTRIKFHSDLTGLIPTPEAIPPFVRRYGTEQTWYMHEAVHRAIDDAQLLDCSEAGLIVGAESGMKADTEVWDKFQKVPKTSRLGSTPVFKCMASNPTAVLSHVFGLKGPSFTLSSACSSGGHSIGIAYKLIQSGMSDIMICGGCEEVNLESTYAFDALGNFAEDANGVRPFDAERKGLAPSGGAACLVLESEEHVKRRGVKPYAEVLGYGATSSSELAESSVSSEVKCMLMALGNIRSVEVISAHATGTIQGDSAEADAILSVFPDCPYISATKALTGHELRMAGASELIYSILATGNGFVPPNPRSADNSLGLNIHRSRVDLGRAEERLVLSNSFGLGGTNSSILIRLWKENK